MSSYDLLATLRSRQNYVIVFPMILGISVDQSEYPKGHLRIKIFYWLSDLLKCLLFHLCFELLLPMVRPPKQIRWTDKGHPCRVPLCKSMGFACNWLTPRVASGTAYKAEIIRIKNGPQSILFKTTFRNGVSKVSNAFSISIAKAIVGTFALKQYENK